MQNKEISLATQDNKQSVIKKVNDELLMQTRDPAVMRALVATTFKGFKDENLVKKACLEAMINGYTFQDIIQKKVYAIPFGSGYSLVQSIADVRAVAMRGGCVGKSAPVFTEKDGKIETCSITVKRKIGDTIGDFTALVYFDEYNKKRDNWTTKPRTMISKVAEMHALRMAFPEELSKAYIEDEFNNQERTNQERDLTPPADVDVSDYSDKLSEATDVETLKTIWDKFPQSAQNDEKLIAKKDEMKKFFEKPADQSKNQDEELKVEPLPENEIESPFDKDKK